MTTHTQFEQLKAVGYNTIPVYRQRLADTDTPLSVFARLRDHTQAYLFESVEGGENWARYSIIGLGESTVFSCNAGQLTIKNPQGQISTQPCTDPFTYIREYQQQFKVPPHALTPELPQFSGGLVGYFGYDAVRYIEPRLNNVPEADPVGLPDIWMMLSKTVIIFDNLKDTLFLIVHADTAHEDAFTQAQHQLDSLEQLLATPVSLQAKPHTPPHFESLTGKDNFLASIETVKEYIRAGMSCRWFRVIVWYRILMGILYRFTVRCVILIHRRIFFGAGTDLNRSDTVSCCGFFTRDFIASGRWDCHSTTTGRYPTTWQDQRRRSGAEKELLADEKEIAEHLMLIDLGRNDVGRVSKIGKVQVTDRMVIERYSHVMHIVSNVQGEVRDDIDALDVFKATFPAGTLSGAPKIRAMEIIDEVEPVKRGIFGGAVGYLGRHGEMDMSIAIRTCVIRENKVYVQAGAGLVADSNPESEWNETQIKARAVIKAVELSSNGLIL